MAQTMVRGTQVLDHTIQRDDLDVSTVGNAVVAKIVQGTNVTLTSTGADSGTGDVTITAAGMQWVPYTTSGQSFLYQDLTRDGDWTMVANKDTTTRPAPQPSGAEQDLLPAWAPASANARASYTLYNEWTINTAGWVDQYGIDVITQNVGATHAVTLSVNGVVKDTFSATPTATELYWHDITPIVVASGAVIRVTLQVTQVSNNAMYWYQSVGLFATAPTYCSGAVGSKDGAAAGTTAYGCHVMFIPGTASPDWDVVAYGGAGVAGGAGPAGPTGPAGLNAFNVTSGSFTVPASGSTVNVTLGDASWVVVGQMVVVAGAGGGSVAGSMYVTAKSGNQITLQTP